MSKQTACLYTDGASRGNPGKAGAGIVLSDPQNNILIQSKKFLGNCTNNEAEYRALILGLQEALNLKYRELEIFLDSELVVRQMEGLYKIKNANLARFAAETKKLLTHFDRYSFKHIPRHLNAAADRLANEAINEYNHHMPE